MLLEKRLFYEAYSQKCRRHRGICIAHTLARVAVVVACLVLVSVCSTAGFTAPSEYELKAAFLFNFASYIEWPSHVTADSGGSFVIGVYGDNSFANLLEQTVSGKSVNGKKVELRRFSSPRDLKPCHMLFISSSEEGRTGRILAAIKDWHVLTIGESDGFARNGGIIGFFLEEKKVRFEINPDEARRTGLKISSKLLKLARVVKG